MQTVKTCPECQKLHNRNKFCSSSCSAKYNNSRRKHSQTTKEKIRQKTVSNILTGKTNPLVSLSLTQSHKLKGNLVELKCAYCCKDFSVKPYKARDGRKYCSRTCSAKACLKGGYRQGSVRSYKSGWYESPIAGKVWLDSSYEFILARHFDQQKYLWNKNYKPFPYKDKDGKPKNYIPDFYISNFDLWVESKGYFSENDACKLRDFPHKIKLIGKTEINDKSKWGF